MEIHTSRKGWVPVNDLLRCTISSIEYTIWVELPPGDD